MPTVGSQRILSLTRLLTVAVGVPAVFIAARGYSVLYLFLGLICCARRWSCPCCMGFITAISTASMLFAVRF
ncbi:MAG: hypothetical protein HC873_17930 [Leptolyngbyaceae cyanobacterium SL_1_1]|nr:hypothetical protein [Leptolyngbyaceae cyanobacterium SL_1_1]